MESLVYFLIIAFFLIAAVVVVAFLTLVAGIIGLVAALFIALLKRSRINVLLLGSVSASLAIVGVLVLLLIGGGIWLLANRFDQTMQLQQRYEEADCLELSVAEDYTLMIFAFQDGGYEATLTRSDGRQNYIYGITQYAIVDEYMLGETPHYWFWFDLRGAGPGHYFERRAEFEEAIEELSLTEEPVLLPLSVHCEIEMCVPCPSFSGEPGSSP